MSGTYAAEQTYQTFKTLVQGASQDLLDALVKAKQVYDEVARIKSVFGSTGALMAANLPDVPSTLYGTTGEDVMNDLLAAANDFDGLWTTVSGDNTLIHLRTVTQFGG